MSVRLSSALISGLALAAALMLAGCKEEAAPVVSVDPVRPVKVITLAKVEATALRSYSGSVRARADSALSFRVGGKIIQRLVDVGDTVASGQIIARVDATDLRLSVDAALANYDAAQTRKNLAIDELARVQSLAQKGYATRALLDKATAEMEQASSALSVATAARDQAQNQATYSELRADAAGIVTEVRADVGQVVSPGAPVAVVSRDGEKEVAFAVPEQDVVALVKGQPVKVALWADKSTPVTGTIREIAGSADPLSRTFAVRVALPADASTRLGMTANVEVERAVAADQVMVPLAALTQKDGATVVWLVNRDTMTVSARQVTVGRTTDEGVYIASGLQPGDTIVAAGTQFMREGLKIRIARTETVARVAGLR